MKELRAVLYGVGAMGQLTARLLLQRGVRISGAIGHVNNVGRDLGELIGHERLGVVVSADAEAVLGAAQADIAVLSVHDSLEGSLEKLEHCARAGVNVLSLSEELFYPWRCAPELAARIDSIGKANGVAISAGGIQDIFWVNAVVALSGASQSIESIEGTTVADASEYGPALSREYCIGQPEANFRKITAEEESRANVYTVALEAVASELGLTVTSWKQGLKPIVAADSVEFPPLGRSIVAGEILGAATTSSVETMEGITLRGEIWLKAFSVKDCETSSWKIRGVPMLNLEHRGLPGPMATCAAIVNRIPDVLAAAPGLITVEKLPKPKYKMRF